MCPFFFHSSLSTQILLGPAHPSSTKPLSPILTYTDCSSSELYVLGNYSCAAFPPPNSTLGSEIAVLMSDIPWCLLNTYK